MKVYLVRHGQVPHNSLRQYFNTDDDLTELGIQQAEELRDKMKNMTFDIVICSPLKRTRHTAEIINANNYKVIYDDRLLERNCGDLNGKPLEATNREEHWNYYAATQYGTAEDMKQFFERVYGFLDELKGKEYRGVLVVAHSGVSRAFSGYFDGIQDGKFLHRGLKNCEIKEYEL